MGSIQFVLQVRYRLLRLAELFLHVCLIALYLAELFKYFTLTGLLLLCLLLFLLRHFNLLDKL